MDDLGVKNTATENFLDTDIISAEASDALGHGVDSCLRNETGQEIFEAELLRSDCSLDQAGELGSISEIGRLVVVD